MVILVGTILTLVILIIGLIIFIISKNKGCKEDGDCEEKQYCKDKECIDKCTKGSCDKTRQICDESTFECKDCLEGFDWSTDGCLEVPEETPIVVEVPEDVVADATKAQSGVDTTNSASIGQPNSENEPITPPETSKYDKFIDITDNMTDDEIDDITEILQVPFADKCSSDEVEYTISNLPSKCDCYMGMGRSGRELMCDGGVECQAIDEDDYYLKYIDGRMSSFVSFAKLKNEDQNKEFSKVVKNNNNVGLVYHKRGTDELIGPFKVGIRDGKLFRTFSGNNELVTCLVKN